MLQHMICIKTQSFQGNINGPYKTPRKFSSCSTLFEDLGMISLDGTEANSCAPDVDTFHKLRPWPALPAAIITPFHAVKAAPEKIGTFRVSSSAWSYCRSKHTVLPLNLFK